VSIFYAVQKLQSYSAPTDLFSQNSCSNVNVGVSIAIIVSPFIYAVDALTMKPILWVYFWVTAVTILCLQCLGAVGWTSGRASGL